MHLNAEILSVQVKSSGSSPTLQSRTVTPSSSTQYITPQSRYDALSQVTVYGDSNLIESNIKSGVSIFSVSGKVKTIGQKHVIPCTITEVKKEGTWGIIKFSFCNFDDLNNKTVINVSETSFVILNLFD